jgi:hypothetical protein
MRPEKSALAQVLQTKEQELQYRDPSLPELSYVLSPSGDILLEKEGAAGQEDKITYSDDELKLMQGAIFTHNHPRGRSFSPEDVNLLLVHGLKEIRAIGRNYRYIMSPPPDDPIGVYVRLQNRLQEVAGTVGADLLGRFDAGEITRNEADMQFLHLVWTRLAKEVKLGYSRESINENSSGT